MPSVWYLVAMAVVGFGCAAADPMVTREATEPPGDVPSSIVSTSTPEPPAPTTMADGDQVAPPRASGQAFEWTVTPVNEQNRAELASTWEPDCPVALDDLRLIELSHWDYDGHLATGRLVVHADHVDALVAVFEQLHRARFPIERMELIDAYGGDDSASMRANNTSAFNCREVSGAPGVWSQHAYGGAVDINPLVNPWVQGSRVDPPEGAAFVDRDEDVPGLIRAGDVVTAAFAEVGWGWGGDWSTSKDYQHFSWNGR